MQTKKLREERKGVTALVLLTFNFGLIAILAKYLSFHVSLYQQLYLTIGTAFITGILLFRKKLSFGKIISTGKKDLIIIFLRAFFGFVFGSALYRESLTLTKVSNVTFIQSIPFTALLGFALFGEKFTLKKLAYVLLAFIGVILIAVRDFSSISIWGRGELFSLFSTFLFAISFLSRRWLSDHLNNQEITQIALFFATIMLFTTSLIVDKTVVPVVNNFSYIFLFALILLGIINAVDGVLINFGFKVVPPVLASNILTLESLFAILLAFIFYQELPNVKEFTGGVLIISSVILMNRLEEKEKVKK